MINKAIGYWGIDSQCSLSWDSAFLMVIKLQFAFKDLHPEWQTAASKLLVALGSKASDEVMAELLQMLVPGALPHYFVVLTLANLATENGMPSEIIYASLTFLKLLING